MALNFLGVGFNFGAKDLGLKKTQKEIAAGFSKIFDEILKLKDITKAANLGIFIDQLPVADLDKSAEAVRGLGEALGDKLPEAGNEASVALEKAKNSAESGTRTIKKSSSTLSEIGDSLHMAFAGVVKVFKVDFPAALRKTSLRFRRDGLQIDKIQQLIDRGFQKIKEGVASLNRLISLNKLSLFLQSIDMLKLDRVGSGIREIATGAGQLTLGLEATAAANQRTARTFATAMTGNAREVGRLSSRMSSMAISLNVDVTEVGKAFQSVGRTVGDVTELGIRDMQTLVKASQVLGMSSEELVGTLADLKYSWGMSSDQLQNMLDSATAIGQQFGMGTGAITTMRAAVQLAGEEWAKWAQSSPEQAQRVILSTTALSGAFGRFADSQEQATEYATTVMRALSEQRTQFEGLFVGMAEDVPELAQQLGISFGDIGTAFETLSQDPIQFALTMREMVQKAGASSGDASAFMARLSQVVSDKLGPAFTWLIKGAIDPSSEALQSIGEQIAGRGGIAGSGGAFEQMVKNGFSTGRTLQETMDLMHDGFLLKLRRMNRPIVSDFVQGTKRQFDIWSERITGLVKEGGPLGFLAKKLIQIQQFGAKALLPEFMWPFAEVLGQLLPMGAAFTGILHSMGINLGFFASPLGLVVAGVGGLVLAMRQLTKHNIENDEAMQALRKEEQRLITSHRQRIEVNGIMVNREEELARVQQRIADKEAELRAGAQAQAREQIRGFFRNLRDKVKAALPIISMYMREAWTTIVEVMQGVDWMEDVIKPLGKLALQAYGAISRILKAIDWGKIFSVIGGAIKSALPVIGKFFGDLGKGLWAGISGEFDPRSSEAAKSGTFKVAGYIGDALMRAVKYAWNFFTTKVIPFVLDFVQGLFNGLIYGADPTKGGKTAASQMGQKIGAWIQHALKMAWGYLKAYMVKWWGKMTTIWSDPSTSFSEKVKATFSNSAGLIIGAFALAKFTPVFGVLKSMSGLLFGAGKAAFGLGKAVFSVASTVASSTLAVASKITALATKSQMAEGTLGRLWQVSKGVGQGFAWLYKQTLTGMKGLIQMAIRIPGAIKEMGGLGAAIRQGGAAVIGFVKNLPMMIMGLGKMAVAAMMAMGPWGLLALAIGAVIAILAIKFPDEAKKGLGNVWQSVKYMASIIWDSLKAMVDGLLLMFKGLWNALAGGWVIIVNAVKAAFGMAYNAVKLVVLGIYEFFVVKLNLMIGVVRTIIAAVVMVFKGFYYAITGQWGKLGQVWNEFTGKLKEIWSTVWGAITRAFSRIVDALKGIVTSFVGFFTSSFDAMKRFGLGVWDALKGAFWAVVNAIKAALTVLASPFVAVLEYIRGFWDKIMDGLRSSAETVIGWFEGAWSAVRDVLYGIWEDIFQPLIDAINDVREAVQDVCDFFSDAWDTVSSWFSDLWGGSPQDNFIDAQSDMANASSGATDQIVANTERAARATEQMGQRQVLSSTQVWGHVERATADYFNQSSRDNQKYLESFEGGFAELRGAVQTTMERMQASGATITTEMARDVTNKSHDAAVRAVDAARRRGVKEEEFAKIARDAQLRYLEDVARQAEENARKEEERLGKLTDLYASTTADTRAMFQNQATDISNRFFEGIGAAEGFAQAQARVMAQASEIAGLSQQDIMQAQLDAQNYAMSEYNKTLAEMGDSADARVAAQAAAVAAYQRNATEGLRNLERAAQATQEGAAEAQSQTEQAIAQGAQEIPNITRREVRAMSEDLIRSLNAIKGVMQTTVSMVATFTYNIIMQISKVTTPIFNKIAEATRTAIKAVQDVNAASVDIGNQMTQRADAALVRLDTNLNKSVRNIAQKTGTMVSNAVNPMLDLPDTIKKEVCDKLEENFGTMWSNIVSGTDVSVSEIEDRLGGLIYLMRQATIARQTFLNAQAASMGALVTTGQITTVPEPPGGKGDNPALYDAVMRPAWYDEYSMNFGGFRSEMAEMARTMTKIEINSRRRSGGPAPQTGTGVVRPNP